MRLEGDRAGCPEIDGLDFGSYMDAIEEFPGIYLPDCQTNFDHFDMVLQAIYPLIRRETDPSLAPRLRGVLDVGVWRPPDPDMAPPLYEAQLSLYTMMVGGLADATPDDPVFTTALDEAICVLRRLPQDRTDKTVAAGTQEAVCSNRHGHPNTDHVIPLEERHYDNFIWRLDPYEIPEAHAGTPGLVHSPEDYLLAYWLGRFHGYLSATE